METFWSFLKLVTFVLLLLAFAATVYHGFIWTVLKRVDFHWDRFMNLVWILVIMFGIGEVLLQNGSSTGFRFMLVFVASGLQAYVTIFKYRSKLVDE